MISPSTSLLTIPSDNRTLYYLGMVLKPYNFKQESNELTEQEEKLAFGGSAIVTYDEPEIDPDELASLKDVNVYIPSSLVKIV